MQSLFMTLLGFLRTSGDLWRSSAHSTIIGGFNNEVQRQPKRQVDGMG
jgi:hypothetical protein